MLLRREFGVTRDRAIVQWYLRHDICIATVMLSGLTLSVWQFWNQNASRWQRQKILLMERWQMLRIFRNHQEWFVELRVSSEKWEEEVCFLCFVWLALLHDLMQQILLTGTDHADDGNKEIHRVATKSRGFALQVCTKFACNFAYFSVHHQLVPGKARITKGSRSVCCTAESESIPPFTNCRAYWEPLDANFAREQALIEITLIEGYRWALAHSPSYAQSQYHVELFQVVLHLALPIDRSHSVYNCSETGGMLLPTLCSLIVLDIGVVQLHYHFRVHIHSHREVFLPEWDDFRQTHEFYNNPRFVLYFFFFSRITSNLGCASHLMSGVSAYLVFGLTSALWRSDENPHCSAKGEP